MLLKCNFNPFYKDLYHNNIHTRKVKWSDIFIRGGLVIEVRTKLCYITCVSFELVLVQLHVLADVKKNSLNFEVRYNCGHLSSRIYFYYSIYARDVA